MKSSFLGANSPQGFYSLYEQLLEQVGESWIIKGSPGCGKSTFMKRIAQALHNAGAEVELIRCSADPDSLDGVYIPSLDVMYVDGTSPHVLEPTCPGAVGNYLDLGQFIDAESMKSTAALLKDMYERYHDRFPPAYARIKTARDLMDDRLSLVCAAVDFRRLNRRCKGVIKKELGKAGSERGKLSKRFLSSISFMGYNQDFSYISDYQRVYKLETDYELSRFVTSAILEGALAAGYDCISCCSPLNPMGAPEHVLVPRLSLAFVTSCSGLPYEGEYYRNLRLDGCLGDLKNARSRIRFNKKTASCLLDEAVSTMAQAKALHDEIEAVYRPYIDFQGVTELADKHISRLLDRL